MTLSGHIQHHLRQQQAASTDGVCMYRTREDAESAIQQMNGSFVGHRRVRCGWAQHKADSSTADINSVDQACLAIACTCFHTEHPQAIMTSVQLDANFVLGKQQPSTRRLLLLLLLLLLLHSWNNTLSHDCPSSLLHTYACRQTPRTPMSMSATSRPKSQTRSCGGIFRRLAMS